MQLEDYFDFLDPLDIRVKGTRIGIETILWDYLERGLIAEQIAIRYPSLSLEQMYATLTYYWHNKVQVEAYLRGRAQALEAQGNRQDLHPSPTILHVRTMLEQRQQAMAHSEE